MGTVFSSLTLFLLCQCVLSYVPTNIAQRSLARTTKFLHVSIDKDITLIGSSDREFLGSLPVPLQRPQQDLLMKWICRLRGLRRLSASVPLEVLASRTGIAPNKIQSLVILSLRLEQTLVRVNMRLVASVALQFVGKGMELDDLIYEGVRGLRKAYDKFDVAKGHAFSTYAYPWIKDYIRTALASALPITLPRHVYKLLSKVRAIKSRLSAELGRAPTEQELALEMGISMERYEVVRKAIALADRSNGATPLVSDELRRRSSGQAGGQKL